MKYGLMLPSRGPLARPESLSSIAKRAEELGYHVLMFPDHIVMPMHTDSQYPYSESGIFPGTDNNETMEQLTTLAFLAGQTQSIRLVTSVMIVPHRPPVLTAKILSTIDVLSQGRMNVGVGVGWLKEEFEALQTPPFGERGAITDEYIRAFKELWTQDEPNFQGKYCQFSNITFLPKPVQKPHPPIWVGGESRRAIRRAAELGDAWQPIANSSSSPLTTPEQLAEGIGRLGRYVERAGRPPGSVEIVCRMPGYNLKSGDSGSSGAAGRDRPVFNGTADEIASDIRRYEEMGVGHLVASFVPVAHLANSTEEMLSDMEEFANRVVPKV